MKVSITWDDLAQLLEKRTTRLRMVINNTASGDVLGAAAAVRDLMNEALPDSTKSKHKRKK